MLLKGSVVLLHFAGEGFLRSECKSRKPDSCSSKLLPWGESNISYSWYCNACLLISHFCFCVHAVMVNMWGRWSLLITEKDHMFLLGQGFLPPIMVKNYARS